MNAAAGRMARYRQADLAAIRVLKASTELDFAAVATLRAHGFARSLRRQHPKVLQWVDVADRDGSAFALIAFDGAGRPVGTVRLQDSRKGTLEIQRYVDLSHVLATGERPAAQVSRLAALRGPQSPAVMVALFKAAWTWCIAEGIRSMVVATPRRSRTLYEYMHFCELGPAGEFRHAFVGTLPHVTMRLAVQALPTAMRASGHPLCAEFDGIVEQLGLNI